MNFHVKYLDISHFYTNSSVPYTLQSLWTLDLNQYPSYTGQVYTAFPTSPSMLDATPIMCIVDEAGAGDDPVVSFHQYNSLYGYMDDNGVVTTGASYPIYANGFMASGWDPQVFANEMALVYKNSIENNTDWAGPTFLSDFAGYITDLNLVVASGTTTLSTEHPGGPAYIVSFVYPGNDPDADEIIVI